MFASQEVVGSNLPTLTANEPNTEDSIMAVNKDSITPTKNVAQSPALPPHFIENLSQMSSTTLQMLTFITKAALNNDTAELETARLVAPDAWGASIDKLIGLCEVSA